MIYGDVMENCRPILQVLHSFQKKNLQSLDISSQVCPIFSYGPTFYVVSRIDRHVNLIGIKLICFQVLWASMSTVRNDSNCRTVHILLLEFCRAYRSIRNSILKCSYWDS